MNEELRYRHHWILGQTQAGKTTLLEQGALEDICNGHGVLYIDPHGTTSLLASVPKERQRDIIHFDLADAEYPVAWNFLENGDAYAASIFTNTMIALWGYADSPTPQLYQTLYNSTVAMMDKPDGTLLGMYYLLTNPAYRREVVDFHLELTR